MRKGGAAVVSLRGRHLRPAAGRDVPATLAGLYGELGGGGNGSGARGGGGLAALLCGPGARGAGGAGCVGCVDREDEEGRPLVDAGVLAKATGPVQFRVALRDWNHVYNLRSGCGRGARLVAAGRRTLACLARVPRCSGGGDVTMNRGVRARGGRDVSADGAARGCCRTA